MIVLDANILIRAVMGRRVRHLLDTYAHTISAQESVHLLLIFALEVNLTFAAVDVFRLFALIFIVKRSVFIAAV